MVIIGDIHGCLKSLEKLLEQIPADAEIYSTGDLVDRGPDSKGVVSLCVERGIKPVMGNHEHMLLDYLDDTGIYGHGVFFMNGGLKTLNSYGGRMPSAHLDYIRSFPLYIETEYFILSHAGVHQMRTLEEACDLGRDMDTNIIWNRGDIADLGKLQVIGHSPMREEVELKKGEKVAGINIDTGCVYPYLGKLTAISFPDMKIYQVKCLD